MNTIYEPKGRAREYAPFSLNLFTGCDHGCIYCYQPIITKEFNPNYNHADVSVRRGIIESLKRDAPKFKGMNKYVMLSFSGDPYCQLNDIERVTRQALEILLENEIPVSILSKGGSRILQDIDIIRKFGKHIQVGATLTFDNEQDSIKNEPGASLPKDRLETLKKFHEMGIKTWASFEPVCIPGQSINLMKQVSGYVNFYKIGKINHVQFDYPITQWDVFLSEILVLLRGLKKDFYIKKSLQKYSKAGQLSQVETNPDSPLFSPAVFSQVNKTSKAQLSFF